MIPVRGEPKAFSLGVEEEKIKREERKKTRNKKKWLLFPPRASSWRCPPLFLVSSVSLPHLLPIAFVSFRPSSDRHDVSFSLLSRGCSTLCLRENVIRNVCGAISRRLPCFRRDGAPISFSNSGRRALTNIAPVFSRPPPFTVRLKSLEDRAFPASVEQVFRF